MAMLSVSKAVNFTALDKTIEIMTITDHSITDCLAAISDRYFPTGRTVVFSWNKPATLTHPHNDENWEDTETRLLDRLYRACRWPIILSYTRGADMHVPLERGDKHGSYVLVVRTQDKEDRLVTDMREQTQRLQSLAAWNPRARFVIVITGQSTEGSQQGVVKAMLKELSDMQVLNAIVLLKPSRNVPNRHSSHLSDLNVLTWFPFSPPSGYCGVLNRVITTDTWISDKQEFSINEDLFGSKIPPNLGFCPLKISTFHFPPFVIFPDENITTLSNMGGVDMAMLQHISEVMNVSVVLPPRVDNGRDSELVDGKWTGQIGDIMYNNSDLALGSWCFTLEDSLVVEGTDSYFTEEFTFFVPRAAIYPRYLSTSRVFGPVVWLLIFVVMLLAAVMFYLVAVIQTTGESDTYKDITNCLLSAWSLVVGVGVHKMPLSDRLRGLFILWLTYSLAINTVFQTYVTTYILDPGHRYQIDSVEEVIESGSEVYVLDFLYEFLGDNLLKQLKYWRKCGNASECLTTAAGAPGVVLLSGKIFVGYASKEHNCTFMYHVSSSDVLHSHIVMVLKKGSPYLDRINTVIRRLVEGGYPGKFFKDITYGKRSRCSSDIDQYVSMSLNHLQSAFIVMFVGGSLSLLLFFRELMVKPTRRNNRTCSKTS